jgi:hypothetical protein
MDFFHELQLAKRGVPQSEQRGQLETTETLEKIGGEGGGEKTGLLPRLLPSSKQSSPVFFEAG